MRQLHFNLVANVVNGARDFERVGAGVCAPPIPFDVEVAECACVE
jgi:hypothetical protein